ncbi:MAG: ketopantoate reductase family protein [Deltaproteobacteria bacterium]|nr:ketopantoate reductase family protein [Deltaproteobacteria bacterium]
MRYIIYGAGGVGGAIGARLFQHGHETVFICRGEHHAVLQRNGLTFKTPNETLQLRIRTVGHPAELKFTKDDVVILTMKSQDTEGALRDMLRAGATDVSIVCAQNGVDNERMAARYFPRVYGMVVVLPATYLEPGVVLNHSTPMEGVLDAGCYPKGIDNVITQVTKDITACGFSAKPDANIMRWKYAKLLTNLQNALQAACGLGMQEKSFAHAVREEALSCFKAAGIEAAPQDEFRQRMAEVKIKDIPEHPRTGGSTWQSLMRGLPSTEADYLNGEIVLLGRLHGVSTPYNRVLQRIASELARTGKRPGSVTIEDLQRMLPEEQAHE